jgi:hypothetical protein
MKKMWMVAAVVCAALMVSCGGEKKAEKKGEDKAASGAKTEVVKCACDAHSVANPVVAKATELTNKMIEAKKSGNEALIEKIGAEGIGYYDSLSEADQAIFDETSNAIAAAAGMMDETVPVETTEPVAATSGATTVAEPVAANPTVVAKATELANKMVDAIKSGNEVLIEKIGAEAEAYLESLSEADQAIFDETANKIAAAAGLM